MGKPVGVKSDPSNQTSQALATPSPPNISRRANWTDIVSVGGLVQAMAGDVMDKERVTEKLSPGITVIRQSPGWSGTITSPAAHHPAHSLASGISECAPTVLKA